MFCKSQLWFLLISCVYEWFAKCFSESVLYIFADDTNLLFPSKSLETTECAIIHELKLLVQWPRSNKTFPKSS